VTAKRIACVVSDTAAARESCEELRRRRAFAPVEEAEVIVVLGGDGFMLRSIHRYHGLGVPLYGMNCGTVGFLMNEFRADDVEDRVVAAKRVTLYPLRMTARTRDGDDHDGIAYNEVSIIRHSGQTANLRVSVDGQERIERLICDGVLVATPAGSTAYNLSVRGPILPLGANLLALTPISPFRPRRWYGALLPDTALVEIENLDPEARPVIASADFNEVADVVSVRVREDRSQHVTVLFDPGHSLEERILTEQFVY